MADDQSRKENRKKRKQYMAGKRPLYSKQQRSSLNNVSSSTDNASSSAGPVIDPLPSTVNHDSIRSDDSHALNLGNPESVCQFCGAFFWYAERVRSIRSQLPVFSSCCNHGRVKLPKAKKIPQYLKHLLDYNGDRDSKHFRDNIRAYNSMFAFTSIGAKIDHGINSGQGPYVFRINGQNHHKIGSLIPLEGQKPHFAQLYIYDTENEAANRISSLGNSSSNRTIDEDIVSQLIAMFNRINELVKVFRMARDRLSLGESHSLSLLLCGSRQQDGLQYNAPTAAEMAGLVVGDLGDANQSRDIVVEYKSNQLKRIDDLHPSFMAIQYPILFPFGEDGYRLKLPYQNCPERPKIKRGNITRREYYAYVLQQRNGDDNLLIKGGRLYQQYIVDAFTCIEDERLRYIRFKHQQEHFRCEIYQGVQDAFLRGDVASTSIGQRVILPSTFTGGPRYMIQNYHDAMAICRSRGNPDLFITFTCIYIYYQHIMLPTYILPRKLSAKT